MTVLCMYVIRIKNLMFVVIFSKCERECELFAIMYVVARPSVVCLYVCCLSAVTFVHPAQPIKIFGNVSMPFGTLAIR